MIIVWLGTNFNFASSYSLCKKKPSNGLLSLTPHHSKSTHDTPNHSHLQLNRSRGLSFRALIWSESKLYHKQFQVKFVSNSKQINLYLSKYNLLSKRIVLHRNFIESITH